MGKILCATRGGEASIKTQDEAIRLAKERGDELMFLYVVDLDFMNKTAAFMVVDVGGEVGKMGQFLLTMAQERARQQGVEAKAIRREGNTREEIKAAIKEEGVDLVVLGRPSGERNVFAEESLRAFADEIEKETGAKVVLV